MRRFARCLVLLLAPAASFAQSTQPLPALAMERLELDPAALGSLAIGSGELLPVGSMRLSSAIDYERNPLVLYRDGQRFGAVVGNRFTLHLAAAYSPWPRVELSVQAPALIQQSGDDLSVAGYQQPAAMGVGEPLVRARFGVLRLEDGAPADVAAELGVGLPLGAGGALARDGGFSLAPRVMASRQLGRLLASAELGMRLRSTVSLAGDSVGSHLDAGASVATQASQLLRLELMVRTESSFTSTPGSAELLAGARYQLPRSIELFALTGPGLRSGPGTPAFRFVVGIALGRAAPPLPAPIVASVTPPPPPPAVIIDPCAPGQQHEPAQCPDLDDDGDGIPNKADRCPTEKGLPELQGCPAKDADGDGVPDHLDNCPLVPGPASNQGCPLVQKQLVVITRRRLELKQRIYFDTGLATIQRRSFPLLNQVADVLKAHPDLPPLSIGGHTDNKGKPEVNRKLSQARAESVRGYLVKKGVVAGRITAHGFGADRPIDSNLSPTGRANNRRVEFTLTTEETVSETRTVEAPAERSEVKP